MIDKTLLFLADSLFPCDKVLHKAVQKLKNTPAEEKKNDEDTTNQ